VKTEFEKESFMQNYAYYVDIDVNFAFTFNIVSKTKLTNKDVRSAIEEHYDLLRAQMFYSRSPDYEGMEIGRSYEVNHELDPSTDAILVVNKLKPTKGDAQLELSFFNESEHSDYLE
jgi:hypothetical protein